LLVTGERGMWLGSIVVFAVGCVVAGGIERLFSRLLGPGFVYICAKSKWYSLLEYSTKCDTAWNGSGGFAYIDGTDLGNSPGLYVPFLDRFDEKCVWRTAR